MREFVLPLTNATVSSNTVLALRAGAGPSPNVEILRAFLGQSSSTTSAQQRVQHTLQVSGFPTLAGTTAQPLKDQDTASRIVSSTNGAAGTCGTNATAEGAGAKTVQWEDVFNVINGYLWCATPTEKRVSAAGTLNLLGLYLPATPSSTGGWSGGLVFAEV